MFWEAEALKEEVIGEEVEAVGVEAEAGAVCEYTASTSLVQTEARLK